MVLEAIFDFGLWLFGLIADAMPSMAPVMYDASGVLGDLAGFGIWVIGQDMWTVILSTVSGWLTFKMTWGIVLFVYRLIPLI